ncbi:MAG: sulfotransferase [Pseudomonadaceae bacterium]|nr:sulfotransferase [Pseudomonadaceae bacterium]
MKICHFFSPVEVGPESDLFMAQPRVYESMLTASRHATNLENSPVSELDLVAIPVESRDLSVVPGQGFIHAPTLERNLTSLGGEFTKPLPIFADLCAAALSISDADVFVYTNCDIGLQPHFYQFVCEQLRHFEAIAVNRRTIDDSEQNRHSLASCLAEVGKKHPGFDCFVMRRDFLQVADFREAVVGGNWIGRVILANVLARHKSFRVFIDEHLTFHLGDDRAWNSSTSNPIHSHNERCLVEICESALAAGCENSSAMEALVSQHVKGRALRFDGAFVNSFSTVPERLQQDPVFVTGFPRSGTTLMQLLLATQGLLTAPETHFYRILRQLNLEHSTWLNQTDAQRFVTHLESAVDLSGLKFEISGSGCGVDDLFVRTVTYLMEGQGNPSTQRWMEKTPDHVHSLFRIREDYPRVKSVYMIRNPIEAFDSWRRVASGWGGQEKSILELCQMWQASIASAKAFKRDFPNELMFVKLEDLQKTPRSVVQKVCGFLGIPFHAELLDDREEYSDIAIGRGESWKKESAGAIATKDASEFRALTEHEKRMVGIALGETMREFSFPIPEAKLDSFDAGDFIEILRSVDSIAVEPGIRNRVSGLVRAAKGRLLG